MSSLKDKVAVEDETVETSYVNDEKTYHHDSNDVVASEKTDIDSDGESLSSQEAGDAALANAPWQYKLIALVTALLFPRNVYV